MIKFGFSIFAVFNSSAIELNLDRLIYSTLEGLIELFLPGNSEFFLDFKVLLISKLSVFLSSSSPYIPQPSFFRSIISKIINLDFVPISLLLLL